MPSFDVASEVNLHELTNAVDQARRELEVRFDFRGVDASFERKDDTIVMVAESESQLNQMLEILKVKCSKRSIDMRCLDVQDMQMTGKQVKQEIKLLQGIDQPTSKKLIQYIKQSKLKVQHAIHGDKLRITGKKRDDLQEVMALLKQQELDRPLQFENFRD